LPQNGHCASGGLEVHGWRLAISMFTCVLGFGFSFVCVEFELRTADDGNVQRVDELKEELKWEALRADPDNSKARRGKESVGYDLISQRYNDSLDGLRTQYADSLKKYRTDVRYHNLDTRHNPPYNPINAEKRIVATLPMGPPRVMFDATHPDKAVAVGSGAPSVSMFGYIA
jgi:hypothetical protein